MRLMAQLGPRTLHQRAAHTVSRAAARFVERAIPTLAVAIVALIAAAQAGWLTRTAMLPPAAISGLTGHAVQTRTDEAWVYSWFISFFYPSASDSRFDPTILSMRLTEGPHSLGPPHSLHQEIMAKGGGRFSHCDNLHIFSASDNSDPRMSGRSYGVAEALAPSRIVAITTLPMLGLILLRL
jgi:hypothetical protein